MVISSSSSDVTVCNDFGSNSSAGDSVASAATTLTTFFGTSACALRLRLEALL